MAAAVGVSLSLSVMAARMRSSFSEGQSNSLQPLIYMMWGGTFRGFVLKTTTLALGLRAWIFCRTGWGMGSPWALRSTQSAATVCSIFSSSLMLVLASRTIWKSSKCSGLQFSKKTGPFRLRRFARCSPNSSRPSSRAPTTTLSRPFSSCPSSLACAGEASKALWRGWEEEAWGVCAPKNQTAARAEAARRRRTRRKQAHLRSLVLGAGSAWAGLGAGTFIINYMIRQATHRSRNKGSGGLPAPLRSLLAVLLGGARHHPPPPFHPQQSQLHRLLPRTTRYLHHLTVPLQLPAQDPLRSQERRLRGSWQHAEVAGFGGGEQFGPLFGGALVEFGVGFFEVFLGEVGGGEEGGEVVLEGLLVAPGEGFQEGSDGPLGLLPDLEFALDQRAFLLQFSLPAALEHPPAELAPPLPSVAVDVHPTSVEQLVLPSTFVDSSIAEFVGALPVALTLLPVSAVDSTVAVVVGAFAVHLVFLPLSLVGLACDQGVAGGLDGEGASAVFEFDASEEFPLASVGGSGGVVEAGGALEFVEGDFGFDNFGGFFDDLLFGFLLGAHSATQILTGRREGVALQQQSQLMHALRTAKKNQALMRSVDAHSRSIIADIYAPSVAAQKLELTELRWQLPQSPAPTPPQPEPALPNTAHRFLLPLLGHLSHGFPVEISGFLFLGAGSLQVFLGDEKVKPHRDRPMASRLKYWLSHIYFFRLRERLGREMVERTVEQPTVHCSEEDEYMPAVLRGGGAGCRRLIRGLRVGFEPALRRAGEEEKQPYCVVHFVAGNQQIYSFAEILQAVDYHFAVAEVSFIQILPRTQEGPTRLYTAFPPDESQLQELDKIRNCLRRGRGWENQEKALKERRRELAAKQDLKEYAEQLTLEMVGFLEVRELVHLRRLQLEWVIDSDRSLRLLNAPLFVCSVAKPAAQLDGLATLYSKCRTDPLFRKTRSAGKVLAEQLPSLQSRGRSLILRKV